MFSVSKNAIILGLGSDIGKAIAEDWLSKGWNLYGASRSVDAPSKNLTTCDFASKESIDNCAQYFINNNIYWDALVFCPATMNPIGRFEDVSFSDWEQSIQINFIRHMDILHQLLPLRKKGSEPFVLFFAGGGTNNATFNYSAYTVSKISLIKMTELLDAEIQDVKFSILGPGWVRTKMHKETLDAGDHASAGNATKTKEKFETNDFIPMEKVLRAVNFLEDAPREMVGGKNFSAASDFENLDLLKEKIKSDPNVYKLRRFGSN